MHRTPVKSSNLASVGYDAPQRILEIAFVSGGIYQYYGVPASIHRGLMAASSHGQYFEQVIQKGGYRYHKVG
jgi:hypothetical protein